MFCKMDVIRNICKEETTDSIIGASGFLARVGRKLFALRLSK